MNFARIGRTLALITLFFCALLATPLSASDKPPLSPDPTETYVLPSHVSATIRFSGAALARELDSQVPRRLATFEDRLTGCGRRGRMECIYSGYVERTAPIYLRAEGDRLNAAVRIAGFVEGRGARGLGRLLHGKAEGEMTVYAEARPQLTPDWTIALHLGYGFRWTDPPVLHIFGFEFKIARYVEPSIRNQMRRVEARVIERVKALDVRGKAETAWRRAFEPVKIVDDPEFWLQMTPSSVGYAGIHTSGDVLEGALELTGPVETHFGALPPAPQPPPLPPLGAGVAAPGQFEFLVPIAVSYQTIAQAVQTALVASGTSGVRNVEVYPSAGKLVVGLQFDSVPQGAGSGAGSDGWVYLALSPKIDDTKKTLQLAAAGAAAVATSAETPPSGGAAAAAAPADAKLLDALAQNFSVAYKTQYDKLLAAAGAKLSRDLGNGFKSEGSFTSASVEKVALNADDLRVILRVAGHLAIVYTP
jgi:hypothetical protein